MPPIYVTAQSEGLVFTESFKIYLEFELVTPTLTLLCQIYFACIDLMLPDLYFACSSVSWAKYSHRSELPIYLTFSTQ